MNARAHAGIDLRTRDVGERHTADLFEAYPDLVDEGVGPVRVVLRDEVADLLQVCFGLGAERCSWSCRTPHANRSSTQTAVAASPKTITKMSTTGAIVMASSTSRYSTIIKGA